MLSEIGADFVYVLDPDRPEGRTWDNRGVTEDVATGSAAGPTAAYLVNHGLRPANSPSTCIRGASSADPAGSTFAMPARLICVGGLWRRSAPGRSSWPPSDRIDPGTAK